MIKIFLILFLFITLLIPCNAITIDVYYPDNITTTQFYYSVGDEYNVTISNNVTGDLTTVILKSDIEYENVIESPHKIVTPVFKLILVCVLLSLILMVVYLIKKFW